MSEYRVIPAHGGEVFRVAAELGVNPSELVDLSASINPLGTPQSVRSAILESLSELSPYPDSQCAKLRQSLADYHCIPPESILPANGSTELISLIPRCLCAETRKKALIVAPSFSEYERALRNACWQIEIYQLLPDNGFELDSSELKKKMGEGFGLIFVANPGNPSGRLYGYEEMLELAEAAERTGSILVLDEAFIDFVPEESVVGRTSTMSNIIILRSMTKFYAIAGLRIGYAVSSPDIVRIMGEYKDKWSVNTLAQSAGIAALNDTSYRNETIRLIADEREWLKSALSELQGVKVVSGDVNYLLLKLAQSASMEDLCYGLLARRIMVRHCGNFKGLDDSYFRVAVKSRGDSEKFVNELCSLLASPLPLCNSSSDP